MQQVGLQQSRMQSGLHRRNIQGCAAGRASGVRGVTREALEGRRGAQKQDGLHWEGLGQGCLGSWAQGVPCMIVRGMTSDSCLHSSSCTTAQARQVEHIGSWSEVYTTVREWSRSMIYHGYTWISCIYIVRFARGIISSRDSLVRHHDQVCSMQQHIAHCQPARHLSFDACTPFHAASLSFLRTISVTYWAALLRIRSGFRQRHRMKARDHFRGAERFRAHVLDACSTSVSRCPRAVHH